MSGKFQMDREVFDHPIWNDVVQFRLFFYLIGKARFKHEPKIMGDGIKIHRGQWLRSYRNIRRDLEYIENRQVKMYPLSRIKRAIDKLVKDGRISTLETELGTLFTVCNYDAYQGFGNSGKEHGTDHETNMEQYENSDGTVSEQYRNNTKNVKNDMNDMNANDNDDNRIEEEEDNSPVIDETENNTDRLVCLDKFYLAFGRQPNAYQYDDIRFYLDEGLSDEVICHSIEVTAKAGANWNYCRKVMDSALSRNLLTIEQVKEAEKKRNEERRNERPSRTAQKSPVRRDNVPEWVSNPKDPSDDLSEDEKAEKKAKLDKMLAKYK